MRWNMFNAVDFADKLRQARLSKGITVKYMAQRLRTSNGQIRRIETGESISIYALAAYLEVIGICLEDILE